MLFKKAEEWRIVGMKATFYARVGNKDQLETETDIEKSRQKLENLFDRKNIR